MKSPIRLVMYVVFGAIIFLFGSVLWQAQKAEGPKAKTLNDYRNEAEPMMLAEASNHIIGFRRVLHAYVDAHGDYENPNAWTGDVEAEYINPIGGVGVTNVPFKFNLEASYSGNNELQCSYDWKKDVDEKMARDEAEFKAKMKADENPH